MQRGSRLEISGSEIDVKHGNALPAMVHEDYFTSARSLRRSPALVSLLPRALRRQAVSNMDKTAHRAAIHASTGYQLFLSPEDAAVYNLRILSADDGPHNKPFLLRRTQPFDILFFRMIFSHLRSNLAVSALDLDDIIPLRDFQRIFERLFYIIGDSSGFDARAYDENGNGMVGWGEFCYVFNKRSISFTLSRCEWLYLTLDDPDASRLGEIIWFIVLFAIVVSSLCMILQTVPDFAFLPEDGSEPQPNKIFGIFESVCLLIFIAEYSLRLGTCWATRQILFDKKKLLELTIGHESIVRPSAWSLIFRFMFSPTNLIDFAAIVPGIVGFFFPDLEGGGFLVLRLVRLTRIFRAFKSPALKQPVVCIARTLSQTTKALYVLAFNLVLGIVIFGSLMYLFEVGTWDSSTSSYKRIVGVYWNETEHNWAKVKAESPFKSIPHALWWAIVTITTVGYGDMSPTTSMGYIIASVAMVLSMVGMALPVGVIGGTFSKVWQNYDLEKAMELDSLKKERYYITSAIQSIQPFVLSKFMLIEVWNERLVDDHESMRLPPAAEFMGEVKIDLNLSQASPVKKRVTLDLLRNDEKVKRPVRGRITCIYEWIPDTECACEWEMQVSSGSSEDIGDIERDCTVSNMPNHFSVTAPGQHNYLKGRLTVTVVAAENLLNMSLRTREASSNAYCTVVCYPTSPTAGKNPYPQVWRTPIIIDSIFPEWNATKSFEFNWSKNRVSILPGTIGDNSMATCQEEAAVPKPIVDEEDAPTGSRATEQFMLAQVMATMHDMRNDMVKMQTQLQSLKTSIRSGTSSGSRSPSLQMAELGPPGQIYSPSSTTL